jgi:hypothetical protein
MNRLTGFDVADPPAQNAIAKQNKGHRNNI